MVLDLPVFIFFLFWVLIFFSMCFTEVALTEEGVVNERLPLRLFATDRYPRKRHNCNSLLSTFFCLEMCLKILKKLPQHTRLVLSEVLDVEHDLQVSVDVTVCV